MLHLVIAGGGFAGVFAAIGAARALDDAGASASVKITLVNPTPYLVVRPRLYEANPERMRVPLDPILSLLDVERVEGVASDLDPKRQTLDIIGGTGTRRLDYDCAILATGSHLFYPDIPGLRAHSFSVDSYDKAVRLERHLVQLPLQKERDGQYTVVVVGGGFTGIEVATEMVSRLAAIAENAQPRVVLVEQARHIGPDLGAAQRLVVTEALRACGIETYLGVSLAAVDASGVTLADGRVIPAATVIWSGGMRASPLTALVPAPRDAAGRLYVDAALRAQGVESLFVAGDVAHAIAAGDYPTYMSCQHAIPLGRIAGHNAVRQLLGAELVPFAAPRYVTCLDLGPWGALFTEGWERTIRFTGSAAKAVKRRINQQLIIPSTSGGREGLLAIGNLNRDQPVLA